MRQLMVLLASVQLVITNNSGPMSLSCLFFKSAHGFFDFCQASPSPVEFIGQIPALLDFSGLFVSFLVHSLGVFEKPLNLFFKLIFLLVHPPAAHRFMLRRIGPDLRFIRTNMAKINEPCFLAEPEDLHKKAGKSFEVALSGLTDGVMIGVHVCRKHPKGDILVGPLLNLARTGNARAVSV